ncbi:hypothetical protein OV203_49995 [Nannocystis sp. ILAH1]|uniref:hypothetical protein n=1 Tax=unclassified Nannocystis TaxID=2627009 RepID=UPI00226DD651|nr:MULTISPECIES: hypothetical protein [unclassified Nannocystis]MCY0995359.1 hypothetical protein [Nannocystis sp. ILAH1]MCY1065185.1 hypothetical protein [Nannocystis sp. RBIL2]
MNIRISTCLLTWALCAPACDEAEEASWRDAAALAEAPPESAPPLDLCAGLSDESTASELVPPHLTEFTDAPPAAKGVCSTGEWRTTTVGSGCDSCPFQPGVPGEKLTLYRRWCYTAPSPPSCGCEEWEYQFYSCYKCTLP